ncbi:MAG: tyrosine-protein phosphatase [Atopostipes suicloacalis]|nr:tyrosine-protein phosphatase [Atopostipes suicloacalis]
MRDMGGYRTNDGQSVKWGKLFRSDDLHDLSQEDQKILEDLAIHLIIDYRNENERSQRPSAPIKEAKTFVLEPNDPVAAIASEEINSSEATVKKLVREEKEGRLNTNNDLLVESMVRYVHDEQTQKIYSQMLKLTANNLDSATLQHCHGGKDRTGYGSALLLLLLGVDEEEVVKDYLRTADFNVERNAARISEYESYTSNPKVLNYLKNVIGIKEKTIRTAIKEMVKKSASPVNYIQEYLNISDDLIIDMRENLLV